MKSYKLDAEDLWERLKSHQGVLEEFELVDMIEQTLVLMIQDHINAQNFKDVAPGDGEAELNVLLQKASEHAVECDSYLEAAFMTTCELEKNSHEDRYVAAKLNLVDVGNSARNLYDKIAFVKKQLNLEKE